MNLNENLMRTRAGRQTAVLAFERPLRGSQNHRLHSDRLGPGLITNNR
jgi:hypothetical protein